MVAVIRPVIRSVLLLFVTVIILSGCATKHVSPYVRGEANTGFDNLKISFDTKQETVWPAAPQQPRFHYLGELIGEDNLPLKQRSWLVRSAAWLVGLSLRTRDRIELQRPQSVVVDPLGRVLVSDVSRAAVYVFDDAAASVVVWEMATEKLRFASPIGMIGLADGSVWVADSVLGLIAKLDAKGEPVAQISHPELLRPTGLAFDEETGEIYVADSKVHDIKVFNDKGRLLRTLGKHGEAVGDFNGPTHLFFADNKLYVSDTLNARVQVLDGQSQHLNTIGRRGLFVGDMPRPKGVAVDSGGNVYVLESYYDYLLIFNAQGEFLLPVGGTGNGVGQFYLPAGIWVDARGRVFIADAFNGRVVILQYLEQA